ncbi:MAG: peptidoglycan DD-metalloendopeptidase family protein [Firmicutes bacterium]|nr:peptidoglycan DD-metalloendopeptidase family protein [Bacillota bacterium]
MKKIVMGIISIIAVLLVFSLTGYSKVDASLSSDKKETEQNIAKFKKNLDDLENQRFEIIAKLEAVDVSIINVEKKIAQLEKDLTSKEKQLEATTISYNKQKAGFYDHLRNKYEQGDVQYVSVVLDATNLTDVINYNEYYRIIKEKESEQINKLQEVKADLETQKKVIEKNKKTTIEQKNTLTLDRAKLAAVKKTYDNSMASVKKQLAAEEADRVAILKEIAALNRPVSGNYTGNGRLQWPVPSIPTSTTNISGFRTPSRPTHMGMDIGGYGVTGRTIVAADDGEVILAKSYYGYGNTVIIDHNNGMMTLYGHLASIKVKAGQTVSRGQVIGIMGNTGQSSGIHLHIEVIINGTRVNPESYIR